MTEEVKVAILVPTRDTIPAWFAYSLGLAMGYMGKNHPEVDVTLYFNNGTILPEQRTALAKMALREGADWTIWLDSDMRFPSNTFEQLIGHKQPIVAGGYPTRKMPAIEPTVFADRESKIRVYTEDDSTGLEPVYAVGFGCVCVHRDVYKAMPPPWFHVPWDEENMRYDCGEDIYFCRKAHEAGFDVLLDHDLSKDVYHIGNAEFGYAYALSARPYIDQLKQNMTERTITK
jgi:GT2 family glycosyltransferase